MSNNSLFWRFDVSTFRLLGRELITDRITALFELVKNCYDANATKVDVEFIDTIDYKRGQIIIRDNGIGMSLNDIKDKWMVIGANSKRTNLYSPPPLNRRYVGEKGVGRFAVDKLGDTVIIRTKQKQDDKILRVEINWEKYLSAETQTQTTLFTDLANFYEFEDTVPEFESGTEIQIHHIRKKEIWNRADIQRAYREMTKIISPFRKNNNDQFDIYVTASDFISEFNKRLVTTDAILFASVVAQIKGEYHNEDPSLNTQESLVFDNESNKFSTENIPVKSFGPISITIYYFNEQAKRQFSDFYKNTDIKIDGIKIYRDGIVATPFADGNSNRDKWKDLLGIDKRRWRETFSRIGNNEIIGIIDITREGNPNIIDSSNRQGFLDTPEFDELRNFVWTQLDEVAKFKKAESEGRRKIFKHALSQSQIEIKEIKSALSQLIKSNPNLESELSPIISLISKTQNDLIEVKKHDEQRDKEVSQTKELFMSLATVSSFALDMSHATNTTIAEMKNYALFLKRHFPNYHDNEYLKLCVNRIYESMNKLIAVTNFLLSFSQSDTQPKEFNIKELLDIQFGIIYKDIFQKENIDIYTDIQNCMILSIPLIFENIISNLISNSIKALKTTDSKKISFKGYIEENQYVFIFSDNGIGIPLDKRKDVFNLYYTTTAEDGGSGVGLWAVMNRVNTLQGMVEIIESEFGNQGVSFKITFPFKPLN